MAARDKKSGRPLTSLKTGAFSRGLALARVSVSAGARAASHAVGSFFSSEEDKAVRAKELLMAQVQQLADELGELKGSLMKVGQMLSMYGEHFLPPQANELLKSLQSAAPPLDWKLIERAIRKQLSEGALGELEIDPEPMASASLGQVHRAVRKADGRKLAMKVQYPGVDRAIEGDLKALRSLLSLIHIVPKGPKYDDLFQEVRFMLHQEVNYSQELETTQEFQRALMGDSRYVVPDVFPEYSTKRILTTSLQEGVPVDSPEVLALSLERRNALGEALLDLYFRELFVLGAVQTDPHFGNYRIRLAPQGSSEPDRIVLLDFGAVRRLDAEFSRSYLALVAAAHEHDSEALIRAAIDVGFLTDQDEGELLEHFVGFCELMTEPFYPPSSWPKGESEEDRKKRSPNLFDAQGAYRWGESDLPQRVTRKGGLLAFASRFRSPPREIVFLDRKLAGIFIFLSVLKVQINGQALIRKYLEAYRNGKLQSV